MTEKVPVAAWNELVEERPIASRVLDVDLVVVRVGDTAHVLHSRCAHRGANLAGGTVEGGCLVCPDHGWDFELSTGQCRALAGEGVHRFESFIEGDQVLVEEAALRTFTRELDNEPSYVL